MSQHFSPPDRAEWGKPIVFGELAVDAPARTRAALSADLWLAIEHHQLLLHYQPVLSIETGRIECFEALMRWRHPTRGLIMPDDFIPIAEESGAIVELGEWALMRACVDAASWNPALRVAVNVSPIQIRDADLATTVDRALSASGLRPQRLELEITESAPLYDDARYRTLFDRLGRLGVEFVMDDFGSGYATFACFRKFRFDKIKIDRSFIGKMLDDDFARSVVETVIALGRNLDLKVVAEGVETGAQLAMLRSRCCPQAQGYFISPPMPIAFFMAAAPHMQAKPANAGSLALDIIQK